MNAPATFSLPKPPSATPDIVRRFLAWAQRAGALDRAEAASALARAYLHSRLAPPVRSEAVVAMTALLDDPSVIVRRALAEAMASSGEAPRHLALALANDRSEVAAALLARSPVLTDAELVDCVAIGDAVSQCAIARRPNLGAGPSAALAEIAQRDAAIALIGNLKADLPAGVLRRLLERFGDDEEAREALLQRPSLPVRLKAEIAIATAKASGESAARWLGRGRAQRIARETRERTIASIAAACGSEDRAELARSLREHGALTVALLMRSLLGGDSGLFAAALVELARVPLPQVIAFMRNPRGEGFAALSRKAGLPSHTLTVFRAALSALDSYRGARGEGLKAPLIGAVIAACEARRNPALAKILSLLWRFAAEAGRAEAHSFAQHATADARAPRLPMSLDFSPAANDEHGAPLALAAALEATGAGEDAPDLDAALAKPLGVAAPRVELPIDLLPLSQPAACGGSGAAPRVFAELELQAMIAEKLRLCAPPDDRGDNEAPPSEPAAGAVTGLEKAA